MITKSEEEYMEEAIGSKIADYLISKSKSDSTESKETWITALNFAKNDFRLPKEFRKIAMEMAMVNSYQDWVEQAHFLGT
jgi:hypothetical protein